MCALAPVSRAFFQAFRPPGSSSGDKITRFKAVIFAELPMTDPATPPEFEKHRDYLYCYALLQVRDASRADDVVHETLAAVESGGKFTGRSSLKTCLPGILKHRITDLSRRQSGLSANPYKPRQIDAELQAGFFPARGLSQSPGQEGPQGRIKVDAALFCPPASKSPAVAYLALRQVPTAVTRQIFNHIRRRTNHGTQENLGLGGSGVRCCTFYDGLCEHGRWNRGEDRLQWR